MAEPFLSEIRMMSFNFPPKGWAFCNGQILPINQNQALFSLLGTNYGGNGQTTFGLPNLQGAVPIHMGASFTLGQTSGETAHTITQNETPQHTHQSVGTTADAATNTNIPTGNFLGTSGNSIYAEPQSLVTCSVPQEVTFIGGSQPHNNMMPYLVLNFCIALQGIFPSQT
jgi:microcystin-dependent protein